MAWELKLPRSPGHHLVAVGEGVPGAILDGFVGDIVEGGGGAEAPESPE